MAAPTLTGVNPASAKEGATITLGGSNFGAKTAESAVWLRVPDTTTRIGAPIDWTESVKATVPSAASFGGGGPLLVSAANKDGESGTQPFMLLEDPPALELPAPARGIEGTAVTMTGARFGRRTANSKVFFKATGAGATPVEAPIALWSAAQIQIRVPTIAELGAAGPHVVFVRTPWGDSGEQPFLVGELPRIDNLNPDQAKPGGQVVVNGWALGAAPGELRILPIFDEPMGEIGAFEIFPRDVHWTTQRITLTLPPRHSVRSTGRFEITVRTEWGVSRGAVLLVQSRASVTTWTRVEAQARTANLEDGLRLGTAAAVDDAAWMLGRQWQMFEFQGEDAGSPVSVGVSGEAHRLSAWSAGPDHQAPLPAVTPLEIVVERERVIPAPGDDATAIADLRLAAELGFELLRHLARRLDPNKLDEARRWFLQRYAIAEPPPAVALDADSRRFIAVAAGRAPDGGRIYADFQAVLADPPTLPQPSPFTGGDRNTGIAAMRGWYQWCERLISQAPETDPPAWRPQRMEYAFGVAAGDEALAAPEHDGHHLDWYSFVRDGDAAAQAGAPAAPEPFERTVLPSPVIYAGMPAARWWEIESSTVDFGAVAVGASELLALLFVEFGLAYGNDWFSVPLDGLPAASLCRISGVEVTDSFGRPTPIAPFGDGAGSDWRMFELAGNGTADAGDLLMIPDALPSTWSSRPSEEVLLVRDELANLAWAIERIVESPTGRPLDRQQDEAERRSDDAEALPANAPMRYVLATLPPANWYPLIPRAATTDAPRVLARGTLRRDDTPDLPAGRLLEPGRPLELFDEEVPRSGVRVVREWQMGRAPDGSTHLWRTRRKGSGRGEGSSGLRFDVVDPRI